MVTQLMRAASENVTVGNGRPTRLDSLIVLLINETQRPDAVRVPACGHV